MQRDATIMDPAVPHQPGHGIRLGRVVDQEVHLFVVVQLSDHLKEDMSAPAGNSPGHVSSLCGQASQVAACGSHSAGIR